MKKQILNLWKALNKAELSEINGGYIYTCEYSGRLSNAG